MKAADRKGRVGASGPQISRELVERVAHLLTCPYCSERLGGGEEGGDERADPDYGPMWRRLDEKLRQAAERLDAIENPPGFDEGGEVE